MSRCGPDCVEPRPGPQAHCATCHVTFGGVRGFDAHRVDGACVPPGELGMRADDRGVWRRTDATFRVPQTNADETATLGAQSSVDPDQEDEG